MPNPCPWFCLILMAEISPHALHVSGMPQACTAHPEQLSLPGGVYRPSWPLASCLFQRCLMSELVLRL